MSMKTAIAVAGTVSGRKDRMNSLRKRVAVKAGKRVPLATLQADIKEAIREARQEA